MNLILTRSQRRTDGIFSRLENEKGELLAITLEHAYCDSGSPEPKLPPGTYTCVRGMHVLHDGIPFQAFEITGVAGHSGILFHKGNFNRDSEGCVLLGEAMAPSPVGEMVTNSHLAFDRFMAMLEGIDTFTLTVV